ncbi:MAG: DJ-1/PfpI family protein [Candidatus Thorarchaeota archaeon]
MINSYLKRKQTRYLIVGVCFLLTLTISVGITAPFLAQANTQAADPIKILFVMDNEYGTCYNYIRIVFERFGWDITTTALMQTINKCAFGGSTPLDVDILLTEIDDVTEYDILTIMPGSSHDTLRANVTALDLIRDAVSQNLIVTAWCRAVRVLADAGVIDGKNVTGHQDYQLEYEAAGATFFASVPPITDGNIITSVRSTFYREETCNAIGAAVDYYDPNAPALVSTSLNPSPSAVNIDTTLTVSLEDETLIHMVNCKIFELNETGGRVDPYTYNIRMNGTETEGLFECTIRDLDVGNYTVDLYVWDCFLNYIEFIDAAEFSVLEELPITTTNTTTQGQDPMQWMIPGAMIGGAVVVVGVIVVMLKRR